MVLYFGLDNRFLLFVSLPVSLPVSNKHYNNSPRTGSATLKHSNSGFENTVSCVYISYEEYSRSFATAPYQLPIWKEMVGIRFLSHTRQRLPTIYSMVTPRAKSAVSVIRVSGDKAQYVYRKLTRRDDVPRSRQACLRGLYNGDNELIDRALVLYFKSPGSFTGEDVVEFQVHGGRAVSESVLSAIGSLNNRDQDVEIRMADRGEFSRRSFLNGKADLTGLEGINTLINADTEAQRRAAMGSFTGRNKALFNRWRDIVIQNSAQLTAIIDFSEDSDFADEYTAVMAEVRQELMWLRTEICNFIARVTKASIVENGINMTLLGAPNVGKSSLLNQIASDDISIVSDIPGTTRDIVSSIVNINGYKVNLFDTAGIRVDTTDPIEKMGIEKAFKRIGSSDICICVIDGTQPLPLNVLDLLKSSDLSGSEIIFVVNKIDIVDDSCKLSKIQQYIGNNLTGCKICFVSCLKSTGIDELMTVLTGKFKTLTQNEENEDPIIVSDRVKEILEKDVLYGIDQFLQIQDDMHDIVIATEHLRYVIDGIGKITGEVIGLEEVLDVVFSKFCVGK